MITGSRIVSRMDPLSPEQQGWVAAYYERAMSFARYLASRYPHLCKHDIDSDMHTALIYGVHSARTSGGREVYWLAVQRKARGLVRQRHEKQRRVVGLAEEGDQFLRELRANVFGGATDPVVTSLDRITRRLNYYQRHKEQEKRTTNEWRARNRERVRAQQRARYQIKKDELNARRRQKRAELGVSESERRYKQEQAERLREYQRQYRRQNREKIAEQKKRYREENAERIKEWKADYWQRNKERFNEKKRAARRARKAERSKNDVQ